jgi:hypothetical protein
MTAAAGTNSSSSSNRFPVTAILNSVSPVTLPPGLATLAQKATPATAEPIKTALQQSVR